MKKIFFLLLTLIILAGCGLQERKKQLEEREQKLLEREQSVLLKEKEIQLLEDSLKKNLARLDSSANKDSIIIALPDSLTGNWDVNMLCTKTNCSGFAVGDTRKENWIFTSRDQAVSVKAMQGEKLVRVYTGVYNGEGFQLSTPQNKADSLSSIMTVNLKVENNNKLTGERVIKQADGCSSIFKVDVTRSAQAKK